MSKVGNEITAKLRNDIKAKLNEIGAYVDNELPDYIMVMVANQKSRYQMKDDLSLFLGKNTDQFVDWLHESLKSMQEKISANDSNDNSGKKSTKSGKQGRSVDNSGTQEKPAIKSSEINDEANGDLIKHSNGIARLSAPSETNNTSEDISNDQEVVLRLNDDTGDTDELLQEAPDNNLLKKATLKSVSKICVPVLGSAANNDVNNKTPMSTIGAIVTNEPMFVDDDEEDSNTKSVSSVVKIKERKSSVPVEKQANKLLILRAVQEATKSVTGSNKRKMVEDYTPTPIVKRTRQTDYSLDPSDLRHYLKANRLQELESNFPSNPYLDEDEENREDHESTKFIVTLDGVKNRYGSPRDDELTLDEEIDEEFVEIENSLEEKAEKMSDDEKKTEKLKEKCKYWPSCKNGDECLYHHPSSACKSFPNCRFGDKCLFIHPNCKYDSICAKPDCPFVHSAKKPLVAKASNVALAPCKFYPKCTNVSCPFLHPKPCIFGSKCRNTMCKYSHPFNFFSANLPKPHQLKWNAKEHISERKFAVTDNEPVLMDETPVQPVSN